MYAINGHTFGVDDHCKNCGESFYTWMATNSECPKSTCDHKGHEQWNWISVRWECLKCGFVMSNDPNYITHGGPSIKRLPLDDIKKMYPSNDCSHRWKQYHGLKESFEYCEVCDQKR